MIQTVIFLVMQLIYVSKNTLYITHVKAIWLFDWNIKDSKLA
jgi:hypothetical protein